MNKTRARLSIAVLCLACTPRLLATTCTGTVPEQIACLKDAITSLEAAVSTNTSSISSHSNTLTNHGTTLTNHSTTLISHSTDLTNLGIDLTNLGADLSNVETVLGEVTEFLEQFEEFFDLLPEEVIGFIEIQRTVLEFHVQQELVGLVDFLGPDPGCVDPSDCFTFRQDVLELLARMRELMELTTVQGFGGPPPPGLILQFNPLQQLVEDLPGAALYPLYRGLHIGIDELNNEIEESIDSIEAIRLLNQGNCAAVDENREETREHHKRLRRNTSVVKLAGKILTALGKNNVRPGAALWGWLGFEVKTDLKEPIGSVLDGIADSMTALAEREDTRINHCQLMAAICAGRPGQGAPRGGFQVCRDEGF